MSEQQHTHLPASFSGEDEVNLIELLRVVVKRRMVIIKVCAVAFVLSIGYALLLKNIYTATSTVLPPPREFGIGGGGMTAPGGAAFLGAGQNAYLELYVSIFKSRTVLEAVAKRLEPLGVLKTKNSEATRRLLRNAVQFQSGKDGTITVSASNRDPKLAALIANTFVEEMSRRSAQLYISKTGSERHFLEKRLGEVRKELTAAEEELKAFQEKHKTIKADAQATVAVDAIAKLKLEIVTKEVQLASLRNSMTDESSEVKALQAAIGRLKGQLVTMSGRGPSDTVIPSTGSVPAIALEFNHLLREVKILEAVFDQLSKQHEMAKVNESRDSGAVQVIDEAVPPEKKSKPRRKVIVLLATAVAFFGSIVVVFVQEYLSRLSPEDAEVMNEIRRSFSLRRRKG